MRKYKYVEPGENDEPVEFIVTEEDIIRDYFPFWLEQMKKVNKDPGIITHAVLDSCIEDFCVVHWAMGIKDAS